MEESPEQVLARLARHRDAVFKARGLPAAAAEAPASEVATSGFSTISGTAAPRTTSPGTTTPPRPGGPSSTTARSAPAPGPGGGTAPAPVATPRRFTIPGSPGCGPQAPAAAGTPVTGSSWQSVATTPVEFLPPGAGGHGGWRLGESAVLITVLGLALGVLATAISVVAFERLRSAVAFAIVAAMTAAGLAGATKRVPTALWWTVGAVLGCILGFLS